MDESLKDERSKKILIEPKTYTVPRSLFESKEINTSFSITTSFLCQEQIINQAIKFQSEGNLQKASREYQYCILHNFMDYRVFYNYALILKQFGNLKEAESLTRKSIKIKPDFAKSYFILGVILCDLGNLEEAEIFTRKAIEIEPDFVMANYNLGNILGDLGKLEEAVIFTRKAIELQPDFDKAYSNLGSILKNQGKLKEAENFQRRAIELNPDFANAYFNLGAILSDIGNFEEAKESLLKALELQPDFAKVYFALSILNITDKDNKWIDKLFSKDILKEQIDNDRVDIYFARANINHKNKNFKDSSQNIDLANKLKFKITGSNLDSTLEKSKILLADSNKNKIYYPNTFEYPENIFIVGMFRSGSTLLESILSINENVNDLGEVNLLEESFLEAKQPNHDFNLAELYLNKTKSNNKRFHITTNKYLNNYQYSGIICNLIPNAKIIHCFRNPLDNILSIYRAHFAKGNEYSSSLVDCAEVYLDQEELMTEYKNRFRPQIYDLNYDSLVINPEQEIKSLIKWLGWEWNDSYLSPHLNKRSVSTASNVQVRSPINSKSIGGWKNYKDMLKPAIEILTKTKKYQDLIA